MPVWCFIGLGSNLSDPERQLDKALDALAQLPDSTLLARSSLYRSPPLGPSDQPDYLNAVAMLETRLEPEPLLDLLQSIELTQGRVRKDERWGPRSLDLDILLFGNLTLDSARLTIPHYDMHRRAFVLYPLAELAPELAMPDGTPLGTLLDRCPSAGLQRLDRTVLRG
ncbi:2-amino-4-hydroxy-6-hydroxymethyldihydropteridine diphosphokinase [Halopseudomonas nanhaiensis]|uniref:2-amino-4-hydroxy-6- hydroxymethyldihydropteridine diphosphokinase n=1 Tax=Halopseudomonas nanhaiensis TaxID=2830842 RepID=UPI001CBD0A09|nr:2-amino-4-hydroxy-6-hydroxymethyldihydropteridine diphosphokinase [Halopseudomonas nanhaiensis]UAW97960.1 2-amino-4-hydroxy-6-hydroxymethyldihydropteridine diphosphokinase [Halopseudomonas nanhaiensis]